MDDKGYEKVDCWKTTDGRLHPHEPSARDHQLAMNRAQHASELFDSGMSVGECLRAVDYPAEIPGILDSVTRESELVISHWQCQDTPGYKPIRFTLRMSMDVYGHAGSWSGAYGGEVSLESLARYASDKRSVLQPKEKV